MRRLWPIFIFTLCSLTSQRTLAAPSAEDLEFFEQHVRPLLAEHCFACHGPQKQHAELRLDIHSRVLEGGETGPAIIPDKPEKSLLIEAVRRQSLEMPPEEELSSEQIAILETWIQRGAPWPEEIDQEALDRNKAIDQHWAFQPIADPRFLKSARPLGPAMQSITSSWLS